MALEQSKESRIYRGEDKDIFVWLDDEDGRPFDVSSASEIVGVFPKDDGTAIVKKLSTSDIAMINAGGGNFKVILKAADTLNLKLGDNQPVEFRVTINQHVTFAQAQGAITVLESLFPGVV